MPKNPDPVLASGLETAPALVPDPGPDPGPDPAPGPDPDPAPDPEPAPAPASEAPTPRGLTTATAATVADTPTAPYTHCLRFNATGAVQSFTVPVGVTVLNARMWAAGGQSWPGYNRYGGGGGFASGDVSVVPGETLAVVVGQSGDFGGGGFGLGAGGGLSGLFSNRLQRPLLVAGGGGGGSAFMDGSGGNGGAGGGQTGGTGAGPVPGQGAAGATGGAGGADNYGNRGGRGGDLGAPGGSNSRGVAGGVVPVAGLGGGGGAGIQVSNGQWRGSGGGAGYAGGGGAACDAGAASVGGGGGGGSGFAAGPGVSGGVTIAGSGRYAANKGDPLYQAGIGDDYKPGQVVLQWRLPAITVSPGGPPDVTLTRAGETGYPGVRLRADEEATGSRRDVRVELPQGKGLQFVEEGDPGYQLTVQSASGGTAYSTGTLSADGQTLTFTDVDLGLTDPGSTSAMWVAVKATGDSPGGGTHLVFRVGDQTSNSTAVYVGELFSTSQGGPPDIVLPRSGATRYPGVRLRAETEVTGFRRDVRVAFYPGMGLRFVAEAGTEYQLTVQNADGGTERRTGTLSADGQVLTFADVDLGLTDTGSVSLMWVALKASSNSPLVGTYLIFSVGDRATQGSTPIQIVNW
ncbi:hypothetical protein [Streptomyces sp. NPDC002537]